MENKINDDYYGFKEIDMHGYRVAETCWRCSNALQQDFHKSYNVFKAARYHDIGKIFIPKNVLNKTSKLNENERKIIKKHTLFSYNLMIERGYDKKICHIALYHHENYDGTGYYGLKGKEIPLESRIIKIADTYDALISERSYKRAYKRKEALDIMLQNKNVYDKDILKIFIENVIKFK